MSMSDQAAEDMKLQLVRRMTGATPNAQGACACADKSNALPQVNPAMTLSAILPSQLPTTITARMLCTMRVEIEETGGLGLASQ